MDSRNIQPSKTESKKKTDHLNRLIIRNETDCVQKKKKKNSLQIKVWDQIASQANSIKHIQRRTYTDSS